MSLIKCSDCGELVSEAARSCPKCGAPTPKAAAFRRRVWSVVKAVGIVVLALLLLILFIPLA